MLSEGRNQCRIAPRRRVLILVLMEDALGAEKSKAIASMQRQVLILVLMEDALGVRIGKLDD